MANTRKGTAASLSQLTAASLRQQVAASLSDKEGDCCQFEPSGCCQFEPARCCHFETAGCCQFEPEARGLLPVWATSDQTDGSMIHQECCQFKPIRKLRLILFSPLKRMITWWTLKQSALFWKSRGLTLFTVFQELSVPWMSGLTARTVIVNTSLSTLYSETAHSKCTEQSSNNTLLSSNGELHWTQKFMLSTKMKQHPKMY